MDIKEEKRKFETDELRREEAEEELTQFRRDNYRELLENFAESKPDEFEQFCYDEFIKVI